MDKRKHVVPVMVPHVLDRHAFLIIPTPTVLITPVPACFTRLVQWKTMLSSELTLSTLLAKLHLPNKASTFVLIELSTNGGGGELKRPPLRPDAVIPVKRAMQGHPESPCFWEKHIDKILRDCGLQPTVHEPYLYVGKIDGFCVSL